MGFFADLKLVKNKRGYVVEYGGDSLMQIYPKAFTALFKDYATKKFINSIAELSSVEDADDDIKALASKLEKLYTIEKRKFLKVKTIKRIATNTKEYKNIIKAARLIQTYDTSVSDFLNSQISGLSFVNDGQGVFPKPSQLCTANAEERLVQYISGRQEEEPAKPKDVKRLALSYFDKTSELKANPKFMELYNKLRAGTATLQEAYFVHDCSITRKTYATKTVLDYIRKKEKGN
jgi:hypothetical protein